MIIIQLLPDRVTDTFGYGTFQLLDDPRYRRGEHCSSVVAVDKEQKVDMIRHDDIVVNMNRRINLFNVLNMFLCYVSIFCQNDIGRTTNGRPYGNF